LYLKLTDLTAPLWHFFDSLQGDQVGHYAVFYNYLLAIELTLHYGRQIGVSSMARNCVYMICVTQTLIAQS
jgi:hypothetical protein